MQVDRMWVILNRLLTGGAISGDEAITLLRWMLLPDDDCREEEE